MYNLGSVSVKQSAVLNICVLSIVYSRSHDPGRVHNGPIKGTNTRVTPLRSQLSQLSCAHGRDIHEMQEHFSLRFGHHRQMWVLYQ